MVCQIDELERKCRLQQEQIFNLKESLAHQQAEFKLKQTQFEGKQLFSLCLLCTYFILWQLFFGCGWSYECVCGLTGDVRHLF